MKQTIPYTPPTTLQELQDFQKLNYHIEDEDWASVVIDGWEEYEISSYGRLYNTKTKKLRKCFMPFVKPKVKKGLNINSIWFNKALYPSRVILVETVCDLMMYSFYPDYADEWMNPIPLDKNIFNLSFGKNIKYVRNSYYEGDNKYKEEWIWYNGEKTIYTIDTEGIVINQNTGNKVKSNCMESNHGLTLHHRGVNFTKSRARLMAEAYIPNPDNLKNAAIIDSSDIRPSLDNVCWTDRYGTVKK